MKVSQKQQNSPVQDDEVQQMVLLSGFNRHIQKNRSLKETSYIHIPNQKSKRTSFRYLCFSATLLLVALSITIFLFYSKPINSNDVGPGTNDQQKTSVISSKINNSSHKIQFEKIQKKGFMITPSVWMFQKIDSNYLQELMLENNKRFSSLSNFEVNNINGYNYQAYLSQEGNKKLQNVFTILKKRMNKDSSLKHKFDAIQKRLILFSILYEKGGIVIDSPLTLTENFDWIRQIQSNIYVNRGDHYAKPQVVGFYSPFYSSEIKKEQKRLKAGMEEVDRYMVIFPAIESFFVAAKEKAEFIGRIIDEMISILIFPESIAQDVKTGKYQYFRLNTKDIYYQYYLMAGQRVLQAKQSESDKDNTNNLRRNFAIDYYGLFLINCQYGPFKLKVILSAVRFEKKFQNIAKYDLKEYEANIGPMRYLQMPTFLKELNEYLNQIKSNKLKNKIMKGSFVQRMYFPQATEPFIYDNPEKGSINLNAPLWDSLSKIIWVFWDNGLANAPLQALLCVHNLKKMSKSTGFQVKEVNNSNLADYLDPATLLRIEYTLKNAKLIVYPQTKSDLVRLALLYKYGGVYLDASIIAVQSFDWLVNIARFPSQHIFNRYGELPSVLLFWNPNFGGFLEWEVDQVANTKAGWRYCFQNSILIAAKGSQFIGDWLDLLLQLLMKQFSETLKVYKQCNLSDFTRIKLKDQYLLAMDTSKCVIGRKQVWITNQKKTEWKNGMAYYKLWSMPTFFGPFKIRSNMNYANVHKSGKNPFLTRYPQEYVEGIIGKMHFLLKFVTQQRQGIVKFIEQNYNKLNEEAHSQSIFMKYLYDPTLGRLEKIGNKIVLIKTNT